MYARAHFSGAYRLVAHLICSQVEPTKRLSAAEALAHPWPHVEEERTSALSASSALPTSTPRLTPLPTPKRLKALQESGALRKAWDRAAEAGWKSGGEGDRARAAAQKRQAEEIELSGLVSGEEVTLMLPEEVTKKIRRGESGQSMSAASVASAEEGETRAGEDGGGEGTRSSVSGSHPASAGGSSGGSGSLNS